LLHEEINRLPAAYRSAVVLCHLEGRTNEEAAALLCWPVGTVRGRLSRARAVLHSRLARRVSSLSAGFLMARLTQNTAFAEVVPSELVEATARCAVASVRGGGTGAATASPRVLDLANADLATWVSLAAYGAHHGTIRIAVLAALLVAALAVLTRVRDVAPVIHDAIRRVSLLVGGRTTGPGCHEAR
jgi:hypothetical protein